MPTEISYTELRTMQRQIAAIFNRTQADNMISEAEAAAILKISVKTMQNKVSAGELDGLFTVSPVNGERFYFKDKLLGL